MFTTCDIDDFGGHDNNEWNIHVPSVQIKVNCYQLYIIVQAIKRSWDSFKIISFCIQNVLVYFIVHIFSVVIYHKNINRYTDEQYNTEIYKVKDPHIHILTSMIYKHYIVLYPEHITVLIRSPCLTKITRISTPLEYRRN